MKLSLNNILSTLPPEDPTNYRALNRVLFTNTNKTCIVIDDDPTGNQTVYNIPLLTSWTLDNILKEFNNRTPVFFILTNSRSLSQKKTEKIFKEISDNIFEASKICARDFSIINRSDSTLRGHFSEIEALRKSDYFKNAINVFIPVMFEGGRVTYNDNHYISEYQDLIPVTQTAFSKDHTFAYSNANLKYYIEEKTNGQTSAKDIVSLDLNSIRTLNTQALVDRINAIESGNFCIANALNYSDLDKVAHAFLIAEKYGKKIVYRTSSSFIPSYIGLKAKPLLNTKNIIKNLSPVGGITIVGSYVPKASSQLYYLIENVSDKKIIELDVDSVLEAKDNSYLSSIILLIEKNLAIGKDVIIYTSRKLVTGKNSDATIKIASKISDALVTVVKGIQICPKYMIAKGGITSHDLATKGLGMTRSKVIGQILPGVPVWEMGKETRFPNLPYIVFPGNVGNENSLLEIIKKLSQNEQ